MAHVLLPCDLPSWPDVRALLSKLKTCKDGKQVAQLMAKVHETCSISLDPDDSAPRPDHPGFSELGAFVDEALGAEERGRLLRGTLPAMAGRAADLARDRPPRGFLYSLGREEGSFQLQRSFVASLLANAFFSAFPRRSSKTHPTLQDFGMADFFTNLNKRSHQKKLKAFLRYFEKLEEEPKGQINFTRKVVTGQSLPGWLCSDWQLVPLVVRTRGSALEAETRMFRACSCTSLIGGDVLKASTSQEARLFFLFPELLACLCFVEGLGEGEAILVEGVRVHSRQPADGGGGGSEDGELSFGLLECPDDPEPGAQFSDRALLRALNGALAAFLHEPRPGGERRLTPVGESSGEEGAREVSWERSKGYLPLIEQRGGSRRSSASSDCQKVARKRAATARNNSHGSSRLSMKTASQSSVELPPIKHTREEEFYTADEDSGDGSEAAPAAGLRRQKRASVAMNDLLREDSAASDRRRRARSSSSSSAGPGARSSSSSGAGSAGFVLGGGGDSEDDWPSVSAGGEAHERLEDFRKRIRKRTRRRLSRRRSSGSYAAGSSGSSDMEDIAEEWSSAGEEEGEGRFPRFLRPASSEPSLVAPALHSPASSPRLLPLSPEALLSLGPRAAAAATSSSGRLKAYSYDGVSPNLPVPFRAGFRRRRRRHHSEEDCGGDLFPAGRPDERSSSLEDLSSCSHSGRREAESPGEPAASRWPVAAEPSCGDGDSQLRAVILWLAASMAGLPALVVYTRQEPQLNELSFVYNRVLSRQWTVGDLSCEVLRFCRNRISPRHPVGISSSLFGQLIGSESSASSLSYNMSQQSLD